MRALAAIAAAVLLGAVLLFVYSIGLGLPFLLWMGRGLTFFSDEWAFIESRSLALDCRPAQVRHAVISCRPGKLEYLLVHLDQRVIAVLREGMGADQDYD